MNAEQIFSDEYLDFINSKGPETRNVFGGRFNVFFDDPIYDPTKHTIATGSDAVIDDLFSFQVYNKLKNHWRAATAPTDIQDGMIWSDSDDNKLYHHSTSDREIVQSGVDLTANSTIGIAAGPLLTFDSGNAWLELNTKLAIRSATVPHGGVGIATLAIDGTNNNVAGPHVQFTTDADDYPLLAIYPYVHDGISIWFDAYFDGTNSRSSDAGSNYRFYKATDKLMIMGDNSISQGDVITWDTLCIWDVNGNMGLGTSTFGTNAAKSLGIAIGTEPSTSIAGQIEIYAKDSSDGAANATLAFRTEQNVEVIGTFTASHKIKVWFNGTEYWVQLDAV